MSDALDQYIAALDEAFGIAKRNAQAAAEEHNRHLPTSCPHCSEPVFIAGLPCMTCGEVDRDNGTLVVQDTDLGYALVRLGQARRPPVATYEVEM